MHDPSLAAISTTDSRPRLEATAVVSGAEARIVVDTPEALYTALQTLVDVATNGVVMVRRYVSKPPDIAVEKVRELLQERETLRRHTHGFAYPDCPQCARLMALDELFGR